MEIINRKLEENRNVVRDNKLINGRVKLNSKVYDLTRTFISLIEKDDKDFKAYSISVKDLKIDYKIAKSVIREIMSRPIEIKNDENERFESFSWFVTMKYNKGVIEAKINPELKEMMLELKGNFTKTFEKYIIPLSSIYAKRLYELLYQNKGIGYRKFEINDLYEKLQVSKTLKRYSAFKQKILSIAIRQINNYTDLYLDLPLDNFSSQEWIKLQCGKQRGITHLNFTILTNPKNVNKDDIILQWVNKIRKNYINKRIMQYKKNDYNGYISVSAKGKLYIQDEMGNSLGINIIKDKSWLLWTWMYKNIDKTFITN